MLELGGFLGGRIDKDSLDGTLNEIGAEGWELVATMTTALYQGRTQSATLIFKRPVSDDRPAG
jgi:hypothetical protein